jgi:hypothetical protein
VEAEKKDFGKANCLFLLISMKETQDKLEKKYNKKKKIANTAQSPPNQIKTRHYLSPDTGMLTTFTKKKKKIENIHIITLHIEYLTLVHEDRGVVVQIIDFRTLYHQIT